MDFLAVIRQVRWALDAAQIRYALIGEFAMALRGSAQNGNRLDWALMTD